MNNFLKKHKTFLVILTILIFVLSFALVVALKLAGKENLPASKGTPSHASEVTRNPINDEQEKSEKVLIISSPKNNEITVTSSKFSFAGTSDPKQALIINGETVVRTEDGGFNFEVNLNLGENVFRFEHKGESKVYKINYRYVIINAISPSAKQTYSAGTTFSIMASARRGATVTATFNGETKVLRAAEGTNNPAAASEFINYNGEFTLPTGNEKDVNLGKVVFKAVLDGKSDTLSSGNIICKKDTILDNVTYIAEITAFTAETFDGDTADDFSRPTNNYLPQGTLDYCDQRVVTDSSSKNTYYKLRYGRRVYTEKNNVPEGKATVTKRYPGILPDHNELTFKSLNDSGRHTVLTLGTYWKAPFILELKDQNYTDPAHQDYSITEATYSYVEIKFCYTTVFNGIPEISADNPLFSHCTLTLQNSNYVLRLYLKQPGKFCGWDSSYDSENNLVFSFLHPAKVSYAENYYSTDLTGVKILLDVGHGGNDTGAAGVNPEVSTEAERNLSLARKIKAQLELTGAEVLMIRNDNSAVSADRRCQILKEFMPDICIAVHHDSSSSASANGHSTYYSTPFSYTAAQLVNTRVSQAGIYDKIWQLRWHYYYVARMTACPVVLTENGFISNVNDYNNNISNEEKNEEKAKAITRGIVDYFNTL